VSLISSTVYEYDLYSAFQLQTKEIDRSKQSQNLYIIKSNFYVFK